MPRSVIDYLLRRRKRASVRFERTWFASNRSPPWHQGNLLMVNLCAALAAPHGGTSGKPPGDSLLKRVPDILFRLLVLEPGVFSAIRNLLRKHRKGLTVSRPSFAILHSGNSMPPPLNGNKRTASLVALFPGRQM